MRHFCSLQGLCKFVRENKNLVGIKFVTDMVVSVCVCVGGGGVLVGYFILESYIVIHSYTDPA